MDVRGSGGVRALVAGVLLVLSAGCGRHESNVARGDRDQVLHQGLAYEIADLDPQMATSAATQIVSAALFEGLVREDARDLHPVPGVASRWDVSTDHLQYTFHLRPDARWSDGVAVTSADFVASWKRILSPSLGADNASLLFVLKNAEAFHRGQVTDFGEVGVAAPDALTVVATLAHPAPYFLSLACHMAFLPVPVKVIAQHGPVDHPGNPWARAGHLVSNGPFTLTAWSADRQIVAVRSQTYWDRGHVTLTAVHYYPMDSLDAQERAFRSGQLHLTDALPAGHLDMYRRRTPPVLREDGYLATYFYRINTSRPYLADPRVRRALALAVDREAVVKGILKGGQTPAATFTPPGLDGYAADPILATNFARARSLLAEAGHANGAGLPELDLLLNHSENHQMIAEALQEIWRRELNVRVRVTTQENKTLLAARVSGQYDLLRSDWVADYADPTSFLDLFRTGSGNNHTRWTSPAYDALLRRADNATNESDRRALLRQAEDLMLGEAPIIPIYFYTHVFLKSPSVEGWFPTLLDHHPLQSVTLRPRL